MTKMPICGPLKLPTGLPINTALLYNDSSLFLNSPLPLPLNGFPAMLSTFPAALSSEPFFGNHLFPPFEGSFSPWETHEPPFLFHPPTPQEEELVVFSPQPSGSDTTNTNPVTPNSVSGEPNRADSQNLSSGSDEPNRNNTKRVRSGSGETTRVGSTIDERKRRRMMSNRESARRSRMRKQKHLENLRNQGSRLRIENRELMNRLSLVVHQNQLVRGENECLRSEAVMLRRRLWDIRQVLLVRQLQQQLNPSAWPCNNFTPINEGQLPHHSLIT